jgi:hypothetical protein
MKQKFACVFVFSFLLISSSYSQITKGFWMIGGSGEFSSGKVVYSNMLYIPTTLQLKPKAGYFFFDKFASGLDVNYFFQKSSTGGPATKSHSIGVGPFARYYFLEKDKRVNILSELYGAIMTEINISFSSLQYGFSGGVAVFLNSSVAIEFLPGYQGFKNKDTRSNYFVTRIGIQVHLEKDH